MEYLFNSFLIILIIHWIADFVCQTHWQASNKSKNNFALFKHVLHYSLIMMAPIIILFPSKPPIFFLLTTFFTHFATDYITSRISSKLWAKQDWHNFFVIIGLDQLIHQLTLAVTIIYLYG